MILTLNAVPYEMSCFDPALIESSLLIDKIPLDCDTC